MFAGQIPAKAAVSWLRSVIVAGGETTSSYPHPILIMTMILLSTASILLHFYYPTVVLLEA